jgi:hypothetical protein
LENDVQYDPRKTTSTETALKQSIKQAILNYNTTYLNKFGTIYVASDVEADINQVNPNAVVGVRTTTRVQKRFKFTELNAVLSIQSYQAQRFWSNVAKNCSDFSLLREKIADNSINSWKECLSNKYAYEIIKENINSIGSYQCDVLTNILFSLSENYSQFAIDIIEFFHKLA